MTPTTAGLSTRDLLDLFDRCEAYPGIRAAIRRVLMPEEPDPMTEAAAQAVAVERERNRDECEKDVLAAVGRGERLERERLRGEVKALYDEREDAPWGRDEFWVDSEPYVRAAAVLALLTDPAEPEPSDVP